MLCPARYLLQIDWLRRILEHMSSIEPATALLELLAGLDTELTDAQRIDELTALEKLKSGIAARQARLADAFAASQRSRLTAAGSHTADARRSVAAQVGLARRDSPHKGSRHVGLARTLVHEMPGVLRALERGDTSEWRATIIARETAHLSREHRAQIDAGIADRLHGWGMSGPNGRPGPGRSGWTRTARRTGSARRPGTGGCRSGRPRIA
jgi:hypothetical protein